MAHQLILSYNEQTQEIQVSGPIQHKGLVYMMLALAQDAVRDWHERNKKVTTPSAAELAALTGQKLS